MLFQSGSQFCPINYDMTCGHLPNYFNLQANTFAADSLARNYLCNMPIFNMSAMTPYNSVSIPANLIMQSVLYSAHQQSLQMGGSGIFGANGGLNFTGNIFGGYGFGSQIGSSYNPFGGMGVMPYQGSVQNNGDSSSNGSKKTDAERRAETKMKNNYEKLKQLLKTYKSVNKDNINEDLKIAIDIALNKSGKLEDKYNALKDVVEDIDAADLRKIIPNLDEYRTQLVEAGYDFENSECFEYENEDHTKLVDDARQAIKNIVATSGNVDFSQYAGLTGLTTHFSNPENYVDILNIISLWNENKESGRLILELQKVVRKVAQAGTGESDSRILASKKLVEPLVEAIKAKAADCKKDMTAEEKEELETLKENLENATAKVLGNPMSANWNDLSTAFDNLYTLLRKTEAKRINKEINDKYSFLNEIKSGTINEEIIVNDTEIDLESEKITDSAIENYSNNDRTTQTERKVNSMVRNNILDDVVIDDVTYYQETKETGDREYKRVFTIVDDKVCVVKDVKIENDRLVNLKGEEVNVEELKAEEINTKDIQADYDNIKKAEEAAQAKKDAESNGAKVRDSIDTQYINKENKAKIIETIDSINKDNVMEFLNGVRSEEKSACITLFRKGIKKGYINNSNGVIIINAVLELAKEHNLDNEKYYIKLEEMKENLENGTKKYNSWIITSGCSQYDSAIDLCIGHIYNKIKYLEEKKRLNTET